MSDVNSQIQALVDEAQKSEKNLAKLVETLSADVRRNRQLASAALFNIAKTDPEKLTDHIDAFLDALNRPEAQTRWEALETLAIMVDYDARTCSKGIADAETALFDEESGPVRLGAVRYLCKIGATTTNRSDKVWPLLDEAIQCYHGDLEYGDMLIALVEFSKGKLSDEVKAGFAERMAFDAANSKGSLQKRSQQILDNLS